MSSIGGGRSGWRAGGDKGYQPISMTDEQWNRIFGERPLCPCGAGSTFSCDVLCISGRDDEG